MDQETVGLRAQTEIGQLGVRKLTDSEGAGRVDHPFEMVLRFSVFFLQFFLHLVLLGAFVFVVDRLDRFLLWLLV